MHNIFDRPRCHNHRPKYKFASMFNPESELLHPLSIDEGRITGLSKASVWSSTLAMVETVGGSILVIILKMYNRYKLCTIVALVSKI